MTSKVDGHAFFADPVNEVKGCFDSPSEYRPRGFASLEVRDGERTMWLGSEYPTEFIHALRRAADEIEAQMGQPA